MGREAWMGIIDDARPLQALSIPGTHDSGAARDNGVDPGLPRCQNFSIDAQLSAGIRFLDIRLKKDKDELKVFHGPINCNLTFDRVLQFCVSFLRENTTETIIMLVNTHDDKTQSGFQELFKQKIDAFEHFFLKSWAIPTLGEARGKIVLLRRFKDPEGFGGIDLSNGWPKNSVGVISTYRGDYIHVEDCYEGKYSDTHKKWDVVKEHLDSAQFGEKHHLYITYNSIAGTVAHTPFQYAWGGAGVNPCMNPLLMNYIHGSKNTRWGIVPVDYFNNDGRDNGIVDSLIDSNDSSRIDPTLICNVPYRILGKHANRYFDITTGSSEPGTQLIMYDYCRGENQHFTLESQGAGNNYAIKAVHSQLYLAPNQNGNIVQQAEKFAWKIVPCGGGWCKIVNLKDGKCMDVSNWETACGTPVIEYDDQGQDNQRFRFARA